MNQKNEIEVKKQYVPSNRKSNRTVDIVAVVLCLAAAFLIWLFVVNTNRATIEKTIIVTVDAKTQIEDATGLSVINGRDTTDFSQFKVTLKVSGTQSALDRYKDEDYIIRIQTDRLSNAASGWHDIILNDAILPSDELTLRSMEPYSFAVFVDELVEKEVTVMASVGEGGVSEGKLESIDPINPTGEKMQTVMISGPKSMVDAVARVMVKVNIANYSKSIVVKSQTFEFTDAAGVPYKNDNNYITVKPTEVDVKIVISYEDRQLSIKPKYVADDKTKYQVNISFSDNSAAAIHLSGDSALFTNLENLECDLGNITNETETSFSFKVADLIKSNGEDEAKIIIPDGLTVSEADMEKVITVTITKEKLATEETIS